MNIAINQYFVVVVYVIYIFSFFNIVVHYVPWIDLVLNYSLEWFSTPLFSLTDWSRSLFPGLTQALAMFPGLTSVLNSFPWTDLVLNSFSWTDLVCDSLLACIDLVINCVPWIDSVLNAFPWTDLKALFTQHIFNRIMYILCINSLCLFILSVWKQQSLFLPGLTQ